MSYSLKFSLLILAVFLASALILVFRAPVILELSLTVLFGTIGVWSLMFREGLRIKSTVAKISEPEAVEVARAIAEEQGWSYARPCEARLWFNDHPAGAGPTWEITWPIDYYGYGRIFIDVASGEVLEIQGMGPR